MVHRPALRWVVRLIGLPTAKLKLLRQMRSPVMHASRGGSTEGRHNARKGEPEGPPFPAIDAVIRLRRAPAQSHCPFEGQPAVPPTSQVLLVVPSAAREMRNSCVAPTSDSTCTV